MPPPVPAKRKRSFADDNDDNDIDSNNIMESTSRPMKKRANNVTYVAPAAEPDEAEPEDSAESDHKLETVRNSGPSKRRFTPDEDDTFRT